MLQQPEPDDYVIATGETHSVRELCELAFAEVDLDYREFVKVDPTYYRPAEVDQLIGDASKAHRELGWIPTFTFRELIKEMVASDLAAEERGQKDATTGKGNQLSSEQSLHA
jgi:GDPmannose 4,6-dehydratase